MKTFFTPGPAQLYPTVPQHIHNALICHIGSISHRSQEFQDIFKNTVDSLKKLMNIPEEYYVFFHASATEIWERLLQNCVEKDSFHFVNGSFSDRYYKAANSLKLKPIREASDWGKGFSFQKTRIPASAEMINFTHNETSTGVMLPLEEIYRFRKSHPEALLTVDMVSSAPYVDLEWKQIDAAYFSVQKCFGMPAGLGVLILSERCLEKEKQIREKGKSTGTYHSFKAQYEKAVKNQTVETPNILGIYLLGKVCEDMLEKGIEMLRNETNIKAEKLYTYFEQHPTYRAFVNDVRFRSKTVIISDIPDGSEELMDYLASQQMIVGNGYGKMKGKQIRIANFPAISMQDIDRLLKAIDDFAREK